MKNSSNLVFDSKRSKELVDRLDNLLADYSVFFVNVRGFHWNIRGEMFFELHVKFEELYKYLSKRIDEVAERVAVLGLTPSHAYSEYLNISEIPEIQNVSDTNEAAFEVTKSLKLILTKQKEIASLANDMNDEATASLMGDNMIEQEKLLWMYSSFLDSGMRQPAKSNKRKGALAEA